MRFSKLDMAEFNKALALVLEWEGVYDNDPDDTGGETCYGITRKYEPFWDGWAIVDRLKADGTAQGVWPSYLPLRKAVADYYRKLWDKFRLDTYPDGLSQCFYGGAINQGEARIVRWTQECLLAMGADIISDGNYGPATKQAMDAAVVADVELLIQGLRAKRCSAYFDTARGRVNNRKYLAGWLNRLNAGA